MGNFLDEINMLLFGEDGRFEIDNLYFVKNKLDSLGENARRNLEIGILQDELVKLGFIREVHHYALEDGGYINVNVFISSNSYDYFDEELDKKFTGKFYIAFHADYCIIFMENNSWIDSFGYDKDVLTKVKELIQ